MNLVSPMDLQLHLHQQMLYRQQQITLHHHRPAPEDEAVPQVSTSNVPLLSEPDNRYLPPRMEEPRKLFPHRISLMSAVNANYPGRIMRPGFWERLVLEETSAEALMHGDRRIRPAKTSWFEEMPGSGWLVSPCPGGGPPLPREVTVELQNRRLWQEFHAETTEMIITKLGRRMFPSVQLVIRGLERRARYCLLLEVAPASRRRHKYVGGGGENGGNPCARGWTSAGPAEPQPRINRRVYLHPDSPATGAHWMQHPVSFSKLKLTNNAVDHHNNVVLTSMHKYIPKIWIIRCDDATSLNNLYSQPASSFTFDETEFIAVTAYQNENITKLKIDNNPFAKGFRETGQSRCKRKLHHVTSGDSGLDSSQEHCAGYDEEENNSSSESESNRIQRPLECEGQRLKRAFSETGSFDDSGVSSSGGASPPLPSASINPCPRIENHNPTPRLHRPWADSPPPVQQTPEPKPLHAPLPTHFQLLHPFVLPSHHLAALEFARIHQMHRYQSAGYLSKFYP